MGKYKPYPAYKDSGVEWLGDVPEGWELLRSKFVFDREQRPVRDFDEVVTAFRDGEVTLRTNRRVAGFTNSLKEIGYQGVRKNDLVVHAMDGFAGAIGVSDSNGKCSPVCSICTPRFNTKTSTHYYGRLLRNMALSGFITSLAKGVRERSTEFRFNEFKELLIPVPTIEEQTQIATFLNHETAKIDSLIEKQEKLIKLLKEKRQAVISHAVTKGLDPNVEMKDSGVEWLGEIPAHWEVMQVKRTFSEIEYGISNSTKSEGKYEVLGMGDIHDGKVCCPQKRYVQAVDENLLLVENDLLFNRTNSLKHVGKVGMFQGGGNITFASYLVRIRTKQNIRPELMNYILNTALVRSIARSLALPSINQANLNPNRYGYIKIVLPPQNEQDGILEFLDDNEKKYGELVGKAQKAISLLKERRTALISAAVTGKIDVRDWKAENQTQTLTEDN